MGTQAVELPTPVPRTDPGIEDYNEARRLFARNDLGGALARLAAAVQADPENAEYHNVYANVLWRNGDHDGAIREQASAALLDPRLRVEYARMLDVAGRPEQAVREYEAVLAQNPRATVVEQDVGRLLFRTGDYANAAAHLQRAVEVHPADAVLQQELAYALDQSGDRARATAVYREILEKAPWATATRELLSESLSQQGHNEAALAVVQEGLAKSPHAPLLHRQLGNLLERSGRGAEAAAAYQQYLKLAPNTPDAKDIAARAAGLKAGAAAGEGKE